MAAPELAVNDVLEMTIYCTAGPQVAVNVLHYRVAAIGGAVPQLDAFADRYYVLVEEVYRDWLPSTASFAGVGARRVSPLPLTLMYSTIDEVPGEASGFLMPWQVAGLITLRTPKPGPGGRGRVYIPFPTVNWGTAEGEMTAGGKDQLNAIASQIGPSTNVSAADASWTVTLEMQIGSSPASPVVDQCYATGLFATQRRRGEYGRPNTLPLS